MAKRAIIVAADKGGVGKTFFAGVVLDLLLQAGRRVSAWDCDHANGSFRRYGGEAVNVENLTQLDGHSYFVKALYDATKDDVVCDIPGGHIDDLARISYGGFAAFLDLVRDAGREPVIVTPIGTKSTATTAVQATIEAFQGAHIVVVKNGFFGDEKAFVIFDGTNDGKYGVTGKMAREAGAEIIYVPRLSAATDAIVDAERLTLLAAAKSGARIGPEHAMGARYYLRTVGAILQGTWLDPAGEVAAKRRRLKTEVV